jgi:hypothetical protein
MSPHPEAAGALAKVERHLRRFALGDAACWARLGAAAGASVALHVFVVARLPPSAVAPLPSPPPSEVRFEVVQREPAPVPPAPPPEPPRAPARIPARVKATPEPPKPSEPEPVPETPEPAAPQPEPDLAGITLSGDGPSAFVMPAGNGEARAGVLGALPVRPMPAPAPSVAAKPGPKLVALADLGTRPAPPSLAGTLSKNYPVEARRRNIAGHARVRARIDPDGVPRALAVLEETFAGFGNACRQTLATSRWSPPRDHSGTAVASEVLYTCRFVIEP